MVVLDVVTARCVPPLLELIEAEVAPITVRTVALAGHVTGPMDADVLLP